MSDLHDTDDSAGRRLMGVRKNDKFVIGRRCATTKRKSASLEATTPMICGGPAGVEGRRSRLYLAA